MLIRRCIILIYNMYLIRNLQTTQLNQNTLQLDIHPQYLMLILGITCSIVSTLLIVNSSPLVVNASFPLVVHVGSSLYGIQHWLFSGNRNQLLLGSQHWVLSGSQHHCLNVKLIYKLVKQQFVLVVGEPIKLVLNLYIVITIYYYSNFLQLCALSNDTREGQCISFSLFFAFQQDSLPTQSYVPK